MARIVTWLFVESEQLSIEELTEIIGITSDCSWRRGDSRGKAGKFHETSRWKVGSRVEVDDDMDAVLSQVNDSLRNILDRVRGHEAALSSLALREHAGVFIGITVPFIPSLEFRGEVLKRMGAMDLDLEIDLVVPGS